MRPVLTAALAALPGLALAQAPATTPAEGPNLGAMKPQKQAVQAAPGAAAAGPRLTAKDGAVVTRDLELGFSVFGMANGSFMYEPSEADKAPYLYPGFGGASGGAGLNFVVSYRGIIGLELGFMFSAERATGSVADLDFTVGHTAFHLPILMRLAVPLEKGVRPFFFVGPDIVFPGDAEVTNMDDRLSMLRVGLAGETPQPFDPQATADTYLTWAMGVGFEFLMPIEGQDFRIPLTLRANINPNSEDKAADKVADGSTVARPIYKTEWDIQAMATLGFGWYFY